MASGLVATARGPMSSVKIRRRRTLDPFSRRLALLQVMCEAAPATTPSHGY